jgi:hypothetical protein
LASDRYLEKGMGLMALTGRGRLKSSLAPPSACLRSQAIQTMNKAIDRLTAFCGE